MCRSVKIRMLVQFQLWQCLAGLLLSDFCRGEHLVGIQEGPLYRVKGYPISISCNVTGFSGQGNQDFAFSMYTTDNPHTEIKIISTFDTNYAYAMFSQRVMRNEIVIERLSKTSAVLHLTLLQAEDAGTFECYTPNKFSTYEGTYNAKTTVNVIEDTLEAFYFGPASHRISEGESLQLECKVSSHTMQHTHLSVTWYLRNSTETLPIITLDRDLTVRPGRCFENQYRSGHISMEKVEDTTYRLKMSQVRHSASGEMYCQAEEWIQDPDRSWIRIAHKNTTGSNVEIKTIEVAEVGSFITVINVISGTLQEGGKMEIHCSIQAQNLLGHFFSIKWLKNNLEVAKIGPSGVLTVAEDYSGKENEHKLRAIKTSDKAYVLTIQPVRVEDQGQYQCRATQQEWSDTGIFKEGQSQLSSKETVHVTAKASGLAVVVAKEHVNVVEGETLKLTCNVSGASGPLSVTWQHKKSSGSSFRDVISLSHEGEMLRGEGAQYQDRIVRTFRYTAADFTLEISGAVLSDSGEYKCSVSEWNMDGSGSMKEAHSQSKQASVSVQSIDSLLNVVLRSRDTNVTENSVISMYCTVSGAKVPLDVHWKFQPFGSDYQKDIICRSRNGAISCGKEQKDYQIEAQVQELRTEFTLRLLRASKRQQGIYLCQITAYQGRVQKTQKRSNQLAVSVHSPVRNLLLAISPESHLEVPIKSDTKIDCLIKGTVSNSSRFAVTWMSDNKPLVRMDKTGVTKQDTDQRINMQMTERQTFQLTIQQVRSTDSGQYRCSVEEWIQDPDGIWYMLNAKSVFTELVVNEKASDFRLEKPDPQLVVTEGERVDLKCSLLSYGLDSTFRYSVTWLFEKRDQEVTAVQLLHYSQDGQLKFQEDDPELQHRLYFSRPKVSTFRLSILSSISSDSGRYRCQVDQYHLDCMGKLEWKAGNYSEFTKVSVSPIDSKLQVQKVNHSLSVRDRHAGFTVECAISSQSSDKSHFEVTWFKSGKDGQPMTIFTAKRDGTLHSAISDRGLCYSHPLASLYSLTVPDVDPFDNGQYQCQVSEWLQVATKVWRKVAEDKSGELTVHIQSEENPRNETLILENPYRTLNSTGGEQFDLNCFIVGNKEDPTVCYTLSWLLVRKATLVSTVLLTHTCNGRLLYISEDQQLRSRLQFSRSTATTFHLTVFNSLPTDSGDYQCKVDQYHLGCEGTWEKKATAHSLSTKVTVHNIERKLQVQKRFHSLNLTDHTGYTIECEISSYSSDKFAFEVTWFKSPIDGYTLNIFRVGCYDEPEPEKRSNCSSKVTLGILIPLLCFLLVVNVLLLIKVQKTHSASKKQKACLWAESNPLKLVPESTTGEGDNA